MLIFSLFTYPLLLIPYFLSLISYLLFLISYFLSLAPIIPTKNLKHNKNPPTFYASTDEIPFTLHEIQIQSAVINQAFTQRKFYKTIQNAQEKTMTRLSWL
jgi:disulfide bond formation protein DsbB